MTCSVLKAILTLTFIIVLCGAAHAQGTQNAGSGTTNKACVADTTLKAAGGTFMGRQITSGFGLRDIGPVGSKNHQGFDLDAINPNVGAFMAGEVTFVGPLGNYGNTVQIRTGSLVITYAHANTMTVKKGDTVTAGQNIGNWRGMTGKGTGDHIHLEYGVIPPGGGTPIPTDPAVTQALINSGTSLTDPDFAQKAIAATAKSCNMDPKDITAPNKNDPTYDPSATQMICDKTIFAEVSKQANAIVQQKNQIVAAMSIPPTPPSAVANTPCMSQQMASITNKFSNAPANYTNQIIGTLTGNPVGTLVSGVFRSGYNSGRSAVAGWPQAIGLQEKFNLGMTKLFQSLGLEDSPFAKDLCGLMLDTMLSYVQCSTNLTLPSLGNLPNFNFGGGSCASQVTRNAAYQAASKSSFDILADQPGKNLPRTIPTPAKTGSQP